MLYDPVWENKEKEVAPVNGIRKRSLLDIIQKLKPKKVLKSLLW
jgi:hypothetical protein